MISAIIGISSVIIFHYVIVGIIIETTNIAIRTRRDDWATWTNHFSFRKALSWCI